MYSKLKSEKNVSFNFKSLCHLCVCVPKETKSVTGAEVKGKEKKKKKLILTSELETLYFALFWSRLLHTMENKIIIFFFHESSDGVS